MLIKKMDVGIMGVNCFLLVCPETKEALIIDPGEGAAEIIKVIEREQWQLRYIVNTHGHYDHIGANGQLKEQTGAKIMIHAADAEMLTDERRNLSFFSGSQMLQGPAADQLLADGDLIKVGKTICLQVIHTPGHSLGSIALYQEGHLFAGDTLFATGIGRTDLPGGSTEAIMDSIFNRLIILPEETKVYPGHGSLSTIGEIKIDNPYVN